MYNVVNLRNMPTLTYVYVHMCFVCVSVILDVFGVLSLCRLPCPTQFGFVERRHSAHVGRQGEQPFGYRRNIEYFKNSVRHKE